MSYDVILYAVLGCAYTSVLMRDERQSHISCYAFTRPRQCSVTVDASVDMP